MAFGARSVILRVAKPSAFGTGDWSIAAGDEEADVTITRLPASGGPSITRVEYRLDGGPWVASAGTVSFTITGLTNDQEYDVELRAVNGTGNGAVSDTKQVTPESGVVDPISILGAKLKGWYDHSDLTTLFQISNGTTAVTTDTDPVGYVADKSGNGKHKLQATSGNRPQFRNNGGVARLVYVSGGNVHMAATTPGFPINGLHLFAVINPSDTEEAIVLSLNSGSNAQGNIRIYWTYWIPRIDATNTDDVSANHDTTGTAISRVEVKIVNGVGVTMRRGASETSDASFANMDATHTADYIEGGSNFGVAIYGGPVDICEVIIADGPDAGEITAIRAYLDTKWSL